MKLILALAFSLALSAAEPPVNTADLAMSKAEAAAQQANTSANSLIIIQSFIFAGLVAGYIFKAVEHRFDVKQAREREERAEANRLEAVRVAAETSKNFDAKLDQIHILVNSRLTRAKQQELDARRAAALLLKQIVQAKLDAGDEPSHEAYTFMGLNQTRIEELETEISVRDKQEAQANALSKADPNKAA